MFIHNFKKLFFIAIFLPIQQSLGQLPPNAALPVPLISQGTNMWCWAASGEMIMKLFHKNVSQCIQANKSFDQTACCNTKVPDICINGGWPEFQKYEFSVSITDDIALTWDELRHQISIQKSPVAFSWHWVDGGGHMMVAYGYKTVDGNNYVLINDPWPVGIGDRRLITYQEYVESSTHTHWNDFYSVSPQVIGFLPVNKTINFQSMGNYSQGISLDSAKLQSKSVAEKSLGTFRKINAGPGGPSEDLKLGQPFPVIRIGLTELKNHTFNTLAPLARTKTDEVLYPIQSANTIKSGLTIIKNKNQWENTSFGNTTLTKLLNQTRDKYSKSLNISLSNFYVISIPALNTYFVATKSGEDVTLFPILNDPTLDVKADVPVQASILMPRLIEAAKAHNGLPR